MMTNLASRWGGFCAESVPFGLRGAVLRIGAVRRACRRGRMRAAIGGTGRFMHTAKLIGGAIVASDEAYMRGVCDWTSRWRRESVSRGRFMPAFCRNEWVLVGLRLSRGRRRAAREVVGRRNERVLVGLRLSRGCRRAAREVVGRRSRCCGSPSRRINAHQASSLVRAFADGDCRFVCGICCVPSDWRASWASVGACERGAALMVLAMSRKRCVARTVEVCGKRG